MADKVSAKILADAAKRVDEMNREFDELKSKLGAELEAKKKTYREETQRLAKLEEERISREILSEARLSARRELLLAKHASIKNCLELAAKALTNSGEYTGLLDRIVKAASAEDVEILISENDRGRLEYPWAKKSSTVEIQGGVILRGRSKDANFSIDAAYEALGENLVLELARILFSD